MKLRFFCTVFGLLGTQLISGCSPRQSPSAYWTCPIVIQHFNSWEEPEDDDKPVAKCVKENFPAGSNSDVLIEFLKNSSFIELEEKKIGLKRVFVLYTKDEKHSHHMTVSFTAKNGLIESIGARGL